MQSRVSREKEVKLMKGKNVRSVWLNYENQISYLSANVCISSGKSPSLNPNVGQPDEFNEREVGEPQDLSIPTSR